MKRPEILSPSRTLYAKLTLWVMLTVIVVFTIVTLIVSSLSSAALMRETLGNAESQEKFVSLHVNSFLQAVEVAVAKTVPEVEQSLSNPDQMYDVVRRLLELNPNIIGSTVAFEPNYYPSKGLQFSPYAYRDINSMVLTKQLGSDDYEYHYMDWYLIPKLLKKSYWSEPYFDRGGGEMMMTTYSHPLFDASGNFYAVITADISLEWLGELIKEGDINIDKQSWGMFQQDENEEQSENEDVDSVFLYSHAITFIIGKGGTYITHPQHHRILNETFFKYALQTPDTIDDQVGYEMIDGKSGFKSISRDGTDFVINYAPIERTGWSMGTIIPSQQIFFRSRFLGVVIAIVMLIGLVVLYFVCRTIMKRVTRPLTRFAHSADEIAQGNLNASLPQITSHDEMKRLHDSFSLMQTSLMEQMEELKRVNEQKGRIEGELKVASDIQMSMLPKKYPPYPERNDIEIFGYLTPAKAVGGDLYDFYIRDEKLFFCIGDVSGKGVPASLVMAVSRSLFRNVSTYAHKPDHIVSQMNTAIADQNDSNMFVTFFVGVLDLKTGHLEYCNAGHDAPVLVNVKEKRIDRLPCIPHIPIGLMPGWKFEMQEADIDANTLIFLYTDGLTEATDTNCQLFGEVRIYDVIRQWFDKGDIGPNSLIEIMTGAVNEFVGDAEQSDDLTMLAIMRKNENIS